MVSMAAEAPKAPAVMSTPGCGRAAVEPCTGDAKEALQELVNTMVSEKMEAMWQKGKAMIAGMQKEHSERIQRLTDELAACREECRELRATVDRLRDGGSGVLVDSDLPCARDVGHAESTSTIASGATSLVSSAVSSPEVKDKDSLRHSPEALAGGHLGDSGMVSVATAAAMAAAAAAVPKMPGYLQLGPTLPAVMPFPFGPPQQYGQTAAPALPQGEQRPLSLADALADALPASRDVATARASSPPGIDPPAVASEKALAPDSAMANDGSIVFTVTLRKEGNSLGLNVSHDEQERVLNVEGIFPGTAAATWNRVRAAVGERTICVGDRIFSINGVSHDQARMLQECREQDVLTLTILRRPSAGSAKPTVPATTKTATTLRAEASEFVPMTCKSGDDTK
mmetsp:Transcript_42844/g.123865  ORF Transcript_42844/g.123865 Transcript_42844/m.123865 type:complete len:399 (+) Transcript_42844:105-1301(+)